LHGISGVAKQGELLAILGGSGSGKTSLLNILSGRTLDKKQNNYVQGEILLNGEVITHDIVKTMRSVSFLISQWETMILLTRLYIRIRYPRR
jgi:ABC-type multidrug transport system ATPase subunit